MLPDEIIKQKEWNELSADEMETVKDLAKNEQEYYVLKKMLQVSSEAADEVPMAPAHILQNIKAGLAGKTSNRIKWYWYAAAAIFVLAIGSLFYFEKKDASLFSNASVKQEKEIKTSGGSNSSNDSTETGGMSGTQLTKEVKEITEPAAPDSIYQTTEVAYTAVSVSDQKELLEFITEIY
jgi:hypothetical protein